MWGTYQIQTKQHMAKITGIHYVNDSVEQKTGLQLKTTNKNCIKATKQVKRVGEIFLSSVISTCCVCAQIHSAQGSHKSWRGTELFINTSFTNGFLKPSNCSIF